MQLPLGIVMLACSCLVNCLRGASPAKDVRLQTLPDGQLNLMIFEPSVTPLIDCTGLHQATLLNQAHGRLSITEGLTGLRMRPVVLGPALDAALMHAALDDYNLQTSARHARG